MVIFSYIGLPQVKISPKSFRGYFFDSHCRFSAWVLFEYVARVYRTGAVCKI